VISALPNSSPFATSALVPFIHSGRNSDQTKHSLKPPTLGALLAADASGSRLFRRGQNFRRPLILGVIIAFLVAAKPTHATIHYTVSLAHPEQHLFHVTMEIPGVHGELELQMAAWNALYEIRDFSSHVQQVAAYVDGRKAEITKLDKLTWRVNATGTVKVTYSTFWDDVGPFSAQLNAEHAFINPALILLYVPDRRNEESVAALTDVPPAWNVASAGLKTSGSMVDGQRFLLQAPNYDALADSPVEASSFQQFTLHDLTPPVDVVIHGDNWSKKDVENALRKICAYELKLMDGAPYNRYTFIFHVGKAAAGGGGGMEHANSTAIFASSDAYMWNVSAHEFFHLWNVKRIRPATLEPVDYTREMYTRSLWFAEGVTNTYGSYTLVRTGLWEKQQFYQDLGNQISDLEARPAEQWQSAEESSLDAWLEKYALYTQPQRSVSYYTKGQVLGVLLDIVIRDRTDNQKSLDDVMREMNTAFAKEGKFYRDSLDIRLVAEKVAGGSLSDFFAKYVSGADPLPYQQVLALSGLELRTHEVIRPVLGFVTERYPNGPLIIREIDSQSSAGKSVLRTGDEILRWNNSDPPKRVERWANSQKPGDELVLHIRHEGAEKEEDVVIHLGEAHERYFQVAETANASERERHIREGILHGTTAPVTAKVQ
jgi:predicted metalloprotease with PDZ domain